MFKRLKKRVTKYRSSLANRSKKTTKKITGFVSHRPFLSFFIVLGVLVTLIIISNILGTPKPQVINETRIEKSVQVYHIGSSPKLTVQAQVRKSGVVNITALTPGVVQNIAVTEGGTFYRGQNLVSLSSNYQGGNLASLQRRLAQAQRSNVVDTLVLQKDLLQRQRDIANELNKVQGETDLSKVQKDVTYKQLDLQDKSINLSNEASEIQLQIAQVSEATMYPSAPFAGVVDKVFVKVGQAVNPGTVLMQISEDVKADPVTAIAYVSSDVAKKVSRTEPSIVRIGGERLELYPFYVTQDAVNGLLYAVYYDIPELYRSSVTENGFIQIEIPLGQVDTSSLTPYVPVDALYQTKETNYLFIVKNHKAESRQVTLGEVFGGYVEVLKGLNDGDQVITDRNVISGDNVKVVN